MASNADYTFMAVVYGNGSFSRSGDTGYSDGVKLLQDYLRGIGYTITDPTGRFQASTENAVKGFQYEMTISQDGVAGQGTCKRLYAVRASYYFTTYGKPISESEWGQDNILAGKIDNVDLLARIIIAECGYVEADDPMGVAIVIKNRTGNEAYMAPADEYPNASVYARVIGMQGQYTTANADNSMARIPLRGYHSNEDESFISPFWKNAVNLAKDIVNGETISVTAYVVNGTSIEDRMMTINTNSNKEYFNQKSWNSYVGDYNKNIVVLSVQPLTFAKEPGRNVIYKLK